MYRKKQMSILRYLSRKFAFWTALFSMFAFAAGNLVGTHGWNVMLSAMFAEVDQSLITYDGTVSPVKIPDYKRWAQYGGNHKDFTYDQLPQDFLIDLPPYDVQAQRSDKLMLAYPIGYMGSYATGHDMDGSHPGVDIYALAGTPVVSSMHGVVARIGNDPSGFGNYVVVKTANAPDPADPSRGITLFAGYAHLSEVDVSEGMILEKGQLVGKVGSTGFATTAHLHFQIDRDYKHDGIVGSHMEWPFTTKDATAVGLSYTEAVDSKQFQSRGLAETISPVAYVQAHYAPFIATVAQASSSAASKISLLVSHQQERLQARLNRLAVASSQPSLIDRTAVADARPTAVPAPLPVAASSAAVSSIASGVSVAAAPIASAPQPFARIEIIPDSSEGIRRAWMTLHLRFVDENGNTVLNPLLKKDLVFRTAFGDADFRPSTLTSLDIHAGEATIEILGRTPTVVPLIQPGDYQGEPIKFEAR